MFELLSQILSAAQVALLYILWVRFFLSLLMEEEKNKLE